MVVSVERGLMKTHRFRTVLYHGWMRFQYDRRAQEMIEYALLAASAAAIVSAIFPNALTSHLKEIISTVRAYLRMAAGTRKSYSGPESLFD